MKNNKLIKATAGFALGLALLAPTTNEVFATSTENTNAAELTNQQKFEEALKNTYSQIKAYEDILKKPVYINSSYNLQDEFNLQLNALKRDYNFIKNKYDEGSYKADAEFEQATNTLNYRLNATNQKYKNLNGEVVSKADLVTLTDEEITFKDSLEYISASEDLKKAYNDAIAVARDALGKTAYLSKEENNQAIAGIKNAKDAILRNYEKKTLITDLGDEILAAKEITKNKDVYTTKSYDVFDSARIAAITTHENKDSSYDQIKSALNALRSAKKSLEKIKTSEEEKREKQINDLRDAIKENEKMVAAANYLLEQTPKTVEGVKDKLLNLIKDAEAKTAKGKKALAKLEGIKG